MKSQTEIIAIFDALDAQHPGADTELRYRTPFELLTATILSAQSTDQRVNLVTPALFKRYPTAARLAKATREELEPQIHATGFFRAKSKALIGMAQALVDRYHGEVPADMDALTKLPGVGRKTANVVLGHALGVPGLPVDRHVLRVANRIGLVEDDDPEQVEAELCDRLPPERWTRASDVLILHGRRICKPKPLCPSCSVQQFCVFFTTGAATDDRLADRPTGARKAAAVAKKASSKGSGPKRPDRSRPATRRRSRGRATSSSARSAMRSGPSPGGSATRCRTSRSWSRMNPIAGSCTKSEPVRAIRCSASTSALLSRNGTGITETCSPTAFSSSRVRTSAKRSTMTTW
jgi:endonuclease-3